MGKNEAKLGFRLPRVDFTSTNIPPAPHHDDRLLVEQLVRGDGAAWQAFVETHGRLVRSRVADVASSFGRAQDDSAIDDATAEVFAALLGNDAAALRAFAGRSSLGTYVAVIATRSATRGFARKYVATTGADDKLPSNASDQTAKDPVTEMIEAEQQEKLSKLLEKLSPKQRNVIVMFHLKGISYAEISQKLEMPIGSIGPTLRRAEAKLREWME